MKKLLGSWFWVDYEKNIIKNDTVQKKGKMKKFTTKKKMRQLRILKKNLKKMKKRKEKNKKK